MGENIKKDKICREFPPETRTIMIMNYDHEKVLKENTREQTPAEIKKLRIFAASLLVFLFSTVFFITEYALVDTKHNMYSNYRVSQVDCNYGNTLEYYKF